MMRFYKISVQEIKVFEIYQTQIKSLRDGMKLELYCTTFNNIFKVGKVDRYPTPFYVLKGFKMKVVKWLPDDIISKCIFVQCA